MSRITAPELPPPPVPWAVRATTPATEQSDPRPDLRGDRARWGYLLDRAREIDAQLARDDPTAAATGVHAGLWRLRWLGARLEHMDDAWDLNPGGHLADWQIVPGAMDRHAWEEIWAEQLAPYTAVIEGLLQASQDS